MTHWYVLFVQSGKERKIERVIRKKDIHHLFIPFIPLLETLFRKRGKVKKETELLFPGYLFIETELEANAFLTWITPLIDQNKEIIKILSYDGSKEVAMREEERRGLLALCNLEKCVEASVGVIVGDQVYVKEGALAGREGMIQKIDRHKMMAWISLEFMGCTRLVKVALQVVEKIFV